MKLVAVCVLAGVFEAATQSTAQLPIEVTEFASTAQRELGQWFSFELDVPHITTIADSDENPAEAAVLKGGEIKLSQKVLQDPREMRRLVRHEMTHAYVNALSKKRTPRWLHEGLAQIHDGSDPESAYRFFRGATPLPSLAGLDERFTQRPADLKVSYAAGLVYASSLVERCGRADVVKLLSRLGRGTTFTRALRASCGLNVAELEQIVASRLSQRSSP